MKKRFGDRVEFLGVYVREAHPLEGWRMASNDRSGVAVAQPTTTEERTSVAARCCAALKMSIPLVVDGIDDAVGRAYSGMPDRLYLLDKQRRVAYKGGRGPFGFRPAELEQAIAMMLLDESAGVPVGQANPWDILPKVERGRGEELPEWARALAPALPRTTAAMLELDYQHRARSPLPAKLRARMRYVAAAANRCDYTMEQALYDLRRADATIEELRTLDPKNWPESERAALTFADKLTREAYKVTDEEVAALRKQHGDANVVAMVQLLAYANFQDRLIHALGIPLPAPGTRRPSGEHPYCPPQDIRFARPFAGGAEPARREAPAGERETQPVVVKDAQWQKFDFATLQKLLDMQKAREPRIPVPSFESVRKYMPPTFPKGKELKIKWSLVCLGYQPELASAWTLCTRTFGEEAKQDRVFEESLFWVVTRSLQCFY